MYDLIVVGGGAAGWTAARRGQELGAKVLLVEKTSNGPGWSNARFSGGVVHASYYDPKRPPEELYQKVMVDNHSRADVVDAWSRNAGRSLDWLQSQGAEFSKDGTLEYRTWTLAPIRPAVPGMIYEGNGPDVLLTRMWKAFVAAGGDFRSGTRVTAIVRDTEAVTGVVIEKADGQTEVISGRSVVIADGGFCANTEMLGEYMGIGPSAVLLRGTESSTGDGIRMAAAVGADLFNMSYFYGHLAARDAVTNPNLIPYPFMDDLVAGSALVGKDGKRFGDEGSGGVNINYLVGISESPLDTWAICDSVVWDTAGKQGRVAPNPTLIEKGGTLIADDTIEGLALKCRIPPDQLRETIDDYNRFCAGNGQLDPPRSGTPLPVAQAPFFAVPVISTITITFGGVLVNGNGQALDKRGQPIPGLYAAGGTMGGLQGSPLKGYAGGLMEAVVFGLISAEHAVTNAQY